MSSPEIPGFTDLSQLSGDVEKSTVPGLYSLYMKQYRLAPYDDLLSGVVIR